MVIKPCKLIELLIKYHLDILLYLKNSLNLRDISEDITMNDHFMLP